MQRVPGAAPMYSLAGDAKARIKIPYYPTPQWEPGFEGSVKINEGGVKGEISGRARFSDKRYIFRFLFHPECLVQFVTEKLDVGGGVPVRAASRRQYFRLRRAAGNIPKADKDRASEVRLRSLALYAVLDVCQWLSRIEPRRTAKPRRLLRIPGCYRCSHKPHCDPQEQATEQHNAYPLQVECSATSYKHSAEHGRSLRPCFFAVQAH